MFAPRIKKITTPILLKIITTDSARPVKCYRYCNFLILSPSCRKNKKISDFSIMPCYM